MRILFTALFGAFIAFIVMRVLGRRISAGAGDGSLRYSSVVLALGWLGIIFATILITSMFFGPSATPDVPRSVCAGVFGVTGIVLLFQGVLAKGWWDSSGIRFATPFGKVDEIWRDLTSVRYNSWCGWYLMQFKSGKTIRLSRLLSGYGGVLNQLRKLGHHV